MKPGKPNTKTKNNKDKLSKTSRIEILIVGMGGEGVVSIAETLGLAATIDGKFASQRSTYGASQRGEGIFSEIIISDQPIKYPFIESPDFFLALSKQGFDAYKFKIVDIKNTILFIESTYDYELDQFKNNLNIYKIPARKCAIQNKIAHATNMIMLASFINNSKIISKEALEKAVGEKRSKIENKQNLDALKQGFNL